MADVPALPTLPRNPQPKMRADKKARLRAATHLQKRFLADVDFWYDLFKAHAILAEKQQDPAVRMASKFLDKILAEVREVEETGPPQRTGAVNVLIGVGIERGTVAARQTALQHQDDQRITLTTDAADDAELDRALRPPESVGDPVP